MPEVATWFPVSIYREVNLLDENQVVELYDHSLNLRKKVPSGSDHWTGNTYATINTFNLQTDLKFAPLLQEITKNVNIFAKMHGAKNVEYKIESAWLNINDEHSFQEFHSHTGCIFSCVYWLAAPEGSGDLVFEDPKEPDMIPVKNIAEYNPLSFARINYKAEENALLIFRSYLRHMVAPCTNKTERVSIAVNFY